MKGDLQDGLVSPRKAREVYGLTEEEVAAVLAGRRGGYIVIQAS